MSNHRPIVAHRQLRRLSGSVSYRALVVVITDQQRQAHRQSHTGENERRAHPILKPRRVAGAVYFVMHVVAVVVRPGLGYRLNDGCDVQE